MIKDIANILVQESDSVLKVLEIIDKGSKQVAMVVDKNQKFLGTINDGDIRRALLEGMSLEGSIKNIYSKTPIVANINDPKDVIVDLCVQKKVHQIPILDNNNILIGVEILDELIGSNTKEGKKNKVVLMVGGLGTRLSPLTDKTPKPMLNVGGKPMLHTIVDSFTKYGFTDFVMCVGYKSNVIKNYFGNGERFGIKISYVNEKEKMGTAGALSLLKDKDIPSQPFFVMNGDLLTNVNFEHLLDYHYKNTSDATMCVREYDFQVPFGVLSIENSMISDIQEKPAYSFFVNAGIYVLDSKCIELVPINKMFDMPELFNKLIQLNKNVYSFPLREYWIDIGRIEEYRKANKEYSSIFYDR